jgi:hypothetical protein
VLLQDLTPERPDLTAAVPAHGIGRELHTKTHNRNVAGVRTPVYVN